MVDTEQVQHREMLVRLRTSPLTGIDHKEKEVDPGGARHHRPDEALVPGNVNEGELRAVVELERRVPQVDRDPATLLLGQPVRVLSGESRDEPGLAMVDVSCGADRQRHGGPDPR